MPVHLEWYASHPVLVATYSGTLSADELQQLGAERASLMAGAASDVVVVADVEAFEGLSESDSGQVSSVLSEQRVSTLLLVVPTMLQPLVRRTSYLGEKRLRRVRFCEDRAAALALAVDLVKE